MRTIHIKAGQRQEIAVCEDDHLVEYLLEQDTSAAEAVYLGKVERVVNGMKAAFVDIGQEKNGFLPLEENSKTAVLPKLQAGQRVLVQVKKEAQGTKGAFLSRDVSLCGEYVLLMPMNRHIGVSARIEDTAARNALKQLGSELADGRFGIVMRASAAAADPACIREEVARLQGQWEAIEQAAPTAHAPSMIQHPRTLLDSVLEDYRPRGIDRIVTNDAALATALQSICPVTHCDGDPMTEKICKQRGVALGRHVWLNCGGNLVIDRCEAMTVIDVNTAKFTGKRDIEENVLRMNLEACGEIARQVRLRNLSGIILIDMIDMNSEAHRRQVLDRLEACFSMDRVKTVIHGFTSLGLIEMTRKKSRQPLAEDWTEECPCCHGTGHRNKEEQHG